MAEEQQPKKVYKTNAKRNRNAGNSFERDIVNYLKAIGFEHVTTSRFESKSRDDKKIDIINKDEAVNGRLPYNIQAKCVAGKLDYHKILGEIPKDGPVPVIFHQLTKRSGMRFMTQGLYAITYVNDFINLMKTRMDKDRFQEALTIYQRYTAGLPADELKKLNAELKKLDL